MRLLFLERDIDKALRRMTLEEEKNLTETVNDILFLIPIKSALILFVSAWLISPAGLPLAAQKLLEVLYAGCERMQDWMMG